MIFGSVCSGIGGIDLGLEAVGMQCAWQIEIEPFCRDILAQHWPEIPKYADIHACGKHNLSTVDLLAGGIPCQPHSLAGKRRGSADNRDLWDEFYRLICELRPRWMLLENVPGLLSSEQGRYFGRVLRQLAEAGYLSEWLCLRASDFGAPHRRERVFVVAHSAGTGLEERTRTTGVHGESDASSNSFPDWQGEARSGGSPDWTKGPAGVADASSNRCGQRESEQEPERGGSRAANAGNDGEQRMVADADHAGLQERDRGQSVLSLTLFKK